MATEDEYKPLKFYADNTRQKESGFSKFEKDGKYFFCRYVDGDIVFLSQAYVSAAGRDNGIASVTKNAKLAERYRYESRAGGKTRISLVAGNRQEVAISPDFASRSAAERVAGRMSGSVKKTAAKSTAKKVTKTSAFTAKDGRRGNYRPLAYYKANGGSKNGFNRFSKDGAHYFHYNKNNKIALISEAYTSEAGRDNGVESVKKNKGLKDRYRHKKHKNGKHFFDLVAGNNQEIATSPWYSDKEAGLVAAENLRRRKKTKKTKAKTKIKAKTAKPSAVTAAAPRKGNVEQNYKPLAFYERQTKGRKRGIDRFKGDDGEYYFAYFENNKIALISEGYPTEAARETGAASVEKNIKLEERYKFRGPLKKSKKYDFSLRAGNHKEIARSVWFGSAAAATTGAAYLMGKRKRTVAKPAIAKPAAAVVAATTTVKTPKPKNKAIPKIAPAALTAAAVAATPAMAKKAQPIKPRNKADDYLPCEAYQGRAVNDRINNVAMFKHSNGQFYFALYDAKGDVRLRSEGFTTAEARDSELSGVIRLKDNKDYYKKIEQGDHYIDVLYDDKGREVGRSCLCAKTAAIAPVAAAPIATAAAAVPAATAPIAAVATGSGIWGWLKWLLLGLLALLAMFFLFKACKPAATPPPIPMIACWDGSDAKTEAACPTKVTCWDDSFATSQSACPAEPPKVETFTCWDGSTVTDLSNCPAEPAPMIETPVTETTANPLSGTAVASNLAGRNCGYSDSVLFNTSGLSAKTVGYLGSNPQFGESLSLTPSGFYNKLQNRYETDMNDRAFLNLLARSLGYGRFSDMDASMFSNDVLPNNSTGLLGFGAQHALQFSTLSVTDATNLEAFKVRAANGTDVHFMKRCGNFMYVCNP